MKHVLWMLLSALCACGSGSDPFNPVLAIATLVQSGAEWRYLDDGSDQGTAWREPGFDDSAWAVGSGEFGYGDGGERTILDFGDDPANKHITTYFRRTIEIADAAAVSDIRIELLADDGAVVYLNGVEVARDNMPEGAIDFRSTAVLAISGRTERTFQSYSADPALLVDGNNVVAVEVHQANNTSSDKSFDLELVVSSGAPFAARGPYLQLPRPTGIVVRWRSSRTVRGVVYYGTAPDALHRSVAAEEEGTEHEIALTGLQPDTVYHYGVGTESGLSAGGDETYSFRTCPLPGEVRPIRVWVLGDSGTADGNARAVRDAYRSLAAGTRTDVWLMLGDNAYGSGTDAEYQAAVFDMYPETLRAVPVWPAMGNHDAVTSTSPTESGPFFESFTLPRAAEAGGVPSGTEAYYSFDYGNVHFICLDSQDSDRASGGAMLRWLQADLDETVADFIIAFWHHPPYTKGSHDSDDPGDSGGRMRDMRERALPILEAAGVDLVLCGHSHSYERSFLLNGHYGTSDTLDVSMVLDAGDGHDDGTGAYGKTGPAGAVYAVAGCSGKISGGSLDHPAMFLSLNSLGSLVLDIDGNRLDARFVDAAGAVRDRFTIVRGP